MTSTNSNRNLLENLCKFIARVSPVLRASKFKIICHEHNLTLVMRDLRGKKNRHDFTFIVSLIFI